MDGEIVAYLGAALMVVLAWLAYRYWQRTPTYARRMRESYSDQAMRPLLAPVPREDAAEDELHPDKTAADLSLIDRPPEISDVAADQTEEAPSESTGVEDLLPAESIEDVSDHETEEATTEEATTAGPLDSETLTIAERQPVDAAESADEVVAPIINGATESAPADNGDREAAISGDPKLDPTQPADGSTQPEAEITGDPDPDPVYTEEDTTQAEVETPEEPSAEPLLEPAARSLPMDDGEISEEIPMKPEYRLIEELEPRGSSSSAITEPGSVAALLKEIDERLAALPSGIELIDLPILERRRIADRREELLSDRELLLEQKGRGAHRRRRRSRTKS